MSVLSIPNQSVLSWEPHVYVGIPGGIDQYRPGGASARTVEKNVEDYGADPSGSGACTSAILAAMSACGTNQVVKFGYGVFRVTTGVYLGAKNSYTFRGSGSYVKGSTASPVAIAASGTIAFTVPPGLGWTAGVGCLVCIRNQEDHWMLGTVASYVGTTLTLTIARCSTDYLGTTSSDWFVSQTHLLRETASGDYFNPAGSWPPTVCSNITASSEAAATILTVDTPETLYAGQLIVIDHLNNDDTFDSKWFERKRVQINVVKSVTSTTVELEVPMLWALDVAKLPRIVRYPGINKGIGWEDFSMSGIDAENGGNLFGFEAMFRCWAHNLHLGPCLMVPMNNAFTIQCEVNKVVCTHPLNAGAEGSLLRAIGTCNLYRNSIFKAAQRQIVYSGGGTVGDVFINCVSKDGNANVNHGAHNCYELFEGNIIAFMQSDGYHGSASEDTVFRNWIISSPGALAWVILNRYNRRWNVVGNRLGIPGVVNGVISYGNPNMGSGANSGRSMNLPLYIEGGRVDSSLVPYHRDDHSRGRITGTVVSSGAGGSVITINSPWDLTYFQAPHAADAYLPFTFRWYLGSEVDGYALRDCFPDWDRSSLHTLVLGPATGGCWFDARGADPVAYPAVGTQVRLQPFATGHQEFDAGVQYTTFEAGNFKALAAGGGGVELPLDEGVTLPDSLAGTKPDDWPASLPWPPFSPEVEPTMEAIPAGYFYTNGEWPEAGPATAVATPSFLPSAGTYSATQSVAISCATVGATIYYTTDGSSPTAASSVYSSPISVASTSTLKAFAVKEGLDDSSVRTGTFTITEGIAGVETRVRSSRFPKASKKL